MKITVVGTKKANQDLMNDIELGTRLILKKEPENPADKDAIQVCLEDGSKVGYVANSANTVVDNTRPANFLNGFISTEWHAKVVSKEKRKTQARNGGSFYTTVLIANVSMIEERKIEVEKVIFKLVGAKTLYPNKYVLADLLKDGNKPTIKLVTEKDKIVGYYNEGACGYVDNRNPEGTTPYDEIVVLFKEETMATITEVVGNNYLGSFVTDENAVKKSTPATLSNEVLERILNEGILSQAEITERIDYMKANGVTEKQITTLFGTYKKYDPEIAKLIRNPQVKFVDIEGMIPRVIGYSNNKDNLIFEGDRGVGKNVLTETLSWLYNRPLYEFSTNSQHDNNSLLGGKEIEANEQGAMTMSFSPETIVQAAEYGGILVLDEFNMSLGHVMSIFNSLLDDNRRRITVPGYRLVEADDNFIAIATQNRDYTATFETNEATTDRFTRIVFPPSTSIENTLRAKCPEAPNSIISKCDLLYKCMSKEIHDHKMDGKSMTIRGFIRACRAIDQDIPLKDAFIDCIANGAVNEEDTTKILNAIDDIMG